MSNAKCLWWDVFGGRIRTIRSEDLGWGRAEKLFGQGSSQREFRCWQRKFRRWQKSQAKAWWAFGIDFQPMRTKGIRPTSQASLLVSSGRWLRSGTALECQIRLHLQPAGVRSLACVE